MLSVSLAPVPFSTTGGAPAPAAGLALPAGFTGQTVHAAAPAIGAPITGNQRRPSPESISVALGESAPVSADASAFPTISTGTVRRAFGDSTAFLAQLIDQTDAIKFQPSAAGTPPPARPLYDLSKASLLAPPAQPVPAAPAAAFFVASPVSVEEASAAMPPRAIPETVNTQVVPDKPTAPRPKTGLGAYQASQQRLLSGRSQAINGFEPVDAVG